MLIIQHKTSQLSPGEPFNSLSILRHCIFCPFNALRKPSTKDTKENKRPKVLYYVPAQSRDVTTGRAEQQIDNGQALGLVLVPARILLVRRVLEIVVSVEVELLDELLAELHAAAGVAERIQGRRPRADAHHVGYDHEEAARHAGFRGYADLFGVGIFNFKFFRRIGCLVVIEKLEGLKVDSSSFRIIIRKLVETI